MILDILILNFVCIVAFRLVFTCIPFTINTPFITYNELAPFYCSFEVLHNRFNGLYQWRAEVLRYTEFHAVIGGADVTKTEHTGGRN